MGDMKQRLFGWNYTQPRMYMITLATEGRKPLFGEISGTPTQPRVKLTELGKKVNHAIEYIPHYYPQLTILAQQMMPDHLHFIIYVRKPLPVHLGKVIAGFKAGCNRDYRFLLLNSKTPERQTDNNEEPPIGSVSGSSAAANISSVSGSSADSNIGSVSGSSAASNIGSVSGSSTDSNIGSVSGSSAASNIGSVSGSSAAAEKSILFEPGYHDRVLSHRGQLQAMIDYIHDNPRRLLIKREHSVLFAHRTVTAAGTTFQAIGNDACAAGRLLLLSPWEYQTQKVTLTRDMCNLLNTLAAKLC